MNADYVRSLIDYHIGANNQLWDCVMALTDEQFVQPCPYSLGSVRHHMVHLASTDMRWLGRLQETTPQPSLKFEDFPTRDAARAKHNEIAEQLRAYIENLDDAALARSATYEIPHRGGLKTDPVWQIIAHLVNHGTDHRAQVLRLLYDFGAPTFEQDLIIYLWNK